MVWWKIPILIKSNLVFAWIDIKLSARVLIIVTSTINDYVPVWCSWHLSTILTKFTVESFWDKYCAIESVTINFLFSVV